MKFVVYEVWTTARIIEATDHLDAYRKGQPPVREGLNLCNWHIVAIEPSEAETEIARLKAEVETLRDATLRVRGSAMTAG
jgi:hypothetical protein